MNCYLKSVNFLVTSLIQHQCNVHTGPQSNKFPLRKTAADVLCRNFTVAVHIYSTTLDVYVLSAKR